jgi:hypothetical protein
MGIPAVVSAELRYTAEFVVKHNIGCAVPFSELAYLPKILKDLDYPGMQESIRNVRAMYSFDRMKQQFIRFIREIGA